jgi:hypothetical protein
MHFMRFQFGMFGMLKQAEARTLRLCFFARLHL